MLPLQPVHGVPVPAHLTSEMRVVDEDVIELRSLALVPREIASQFFNE